MTRVFEAGAACPLAAQVGLSAAPDSRRQAGDMDVRVPFAPAARIGPCLGGGCEIPCDLGAEPGQPGGHEVQLLAVQPVAMLSFTRRVTPGLPAARREQTHRTIGLPAIRTRAPRVRAGRDQRGRRDRRDRARAFFSLGGRATVLPRRCCRFRGRALDGDRHTKDRQTAAPGAAPAPFGPRW